MLPRGNLVFVWFVVVVEPFGCLALLFFFFNVDFVEHVSSVSFSSTFLLCN